MDAALDDESPLMDGLSDADLREFLTLCAALHRPKLLTFPACCAGAGFMRGYPRAATNLHS